ncbi:MAG: hypothetical protein RLZZ511_1225 [Cyanobacteriota bacterium]|jgi:hypothetical protein
MSQDYPIDPRSKIQLDNMEQFYTVADEQGDSIDYEKATGRQLFNHYRHNLTNYDQVLDDLRREQGHVTGTQQKQATAGAAEVILEKYRDEHSQVIQIAQKRGNSLKMLMQKAGVGTVSALTAWMDSCSESLKSVAKLENSQRSLRTWNDTYRVQQRLVKQILRDSNVDPQVCQKVDAVYGTKSVAKAIGVGRELLNWEQSEILKLVKSAVHYTKL